MILGASSWFIEEGRQPILAPKRRFVLGDSDYSDWVLRWPILATRLETVDLGTASIALSNIGGRFNSLVESGAILVLGTEIALGLTHPQSGDEWMVLHTGQPSRLSFGANGAELRLEVQGKTRRLTNLAIGVDATSAGVDYTTSRYYPSDLAWYLITSHSGLSADASTANADLDFGEWAAWRATDRMRDIRVKGYFTGQKAYEVLGDLAKLSSIGIGYQQNRIRFADLYGQFSASGSLELSHTLEAGMDVDPAGVVNYFFGEADYNPASGRFSASFAKVNSASQIQFGLRAARFSPRGVWFATAADGRYVAEDEVSFGSAPRPRLSVRTSLAAGLHRAPGDVVTVTNTNLGLMEREMRIVAREVDLQLGTLRFDMLPAGRRRWELQQQVSSSNLVIRTVTAIGSDALVAVTESMLSGRLVRTDSAGVFQPLASFGTAVLALSGQDLILGGPPTSGGLQSVMQRSSDGGSSTIVVASLGAGTQSIHDIFLVGSGTCLASTSSGSILRSTDAGSSWSVTWTVSAGYHVRRFFQPVSGTLWAGTGVDNWIVAQGTHIWESNNAGVSWAPKFSLVPSGTAGVGAFYAVSGSEYLAATMGVGGGELNLFRIIRWTPNSHSWSLVSSLLGFSNVVRTNSGSLLLGYNDDLTTAGGTLHRSFDNGSSWQEDARLAKQGNIVLVPRSGGAMDAYVARMSGAAGTYRFRAISADAMP